MVRTKKRQEKPEIVYTKYQLDRLLKEKQKRFAQEYVRSGWNGTRSYMKIYKIKKDKTAAVLAVQILSNSKVKQYINFIKDDYEMLCGVSKASQVADYLKIARASIAELHNSWITLKEWDKIKEENPDILYAVESTESKTMTKVIDKELYSIEYIKVKMESKLSALARIDKLMDYETAQKVDVSGEVTTSVDVTSYTEEEKQMLLKLSRKNQYLND